MQVSENKYKTLKWLLIAGLLALHVSSIFYERIPVNRKLGWDGAGYFLFAQYIQEGTTNEHISNYYIQRVSVAAGLALFASVTGTPITESLAINFFTFINLISILVAVWCYFQAAAKLKFSHITTLFGFAGIFYSFLILKITAYYPMLVDTPAFAIGFLLLYAMLYRKFLLACTVLLIGAFTFPTVLTMGLILLLFVNSDATENAKSLTVDIRPLLHRFKNLIRFGLPLAGVLVYVVYGFVIFRFKPDYITEFSNGDKIHLNEIWFSAITSAALLFVLLKLIADTILQTEKKIAVRYLHLIVLGALYVLIKYLQQKWSNPTLSLDWKWFTVNLFKQSVQFPASGIVSHVLYFGPLMVLSIIFLKPLLKLVNAYGPGWILFFTLNLVLMLLGNESRQFVFFIPFLLVLTLQLLNTQISKLLNGNQILLHISTCLVVSKVWWTINVEGFAEKAQLLIKTSAYTDADVQRYFISHGPWMNLTSYLWVTGSALLLLLIYQKLFKKARLAE